MGWALGDADQAPLAVVIVDVWVSLLIHSDSTIGAEAAADPPATVTQIVLHLGPHGTPQACLQLFAVGRVVDGRGGELHTLKRQVDPRRCSTALRIKRFLLGHPPSVLLHPPVCSQCHGEVLLHHFTTEVFQLIANPTLQGIAAYAQQAGRRPSTGDADIGE